MTAIFSFMRITEKIIRRIVRNILVESMWHAYDRSGNAQAYRNLVGQSELKKLENDLVAIHWTDKDGAESIAKGNLRIPWVSVSVYHPGAGPIVSHKNRGLWPSLGIILKGDWLFGSINDAFTGDGAEYGQGEEYGLDMLSSHDENESLIKSFRDVPRRPTASAQTEILLGDPRPVGFIILPGAKWQTKRIKDEYAEMELAGEIAELDLWGNPKYGQPEPTHWYEDARDFPADPATTLSHAIELSRETNLPLYDHNLSVLKY